MAFFSTWAPAGTSIAKLVLEEGCRWAIEDSFETVKNELGLDHNETRSWHGWHRVSLVMLAFAMMAAIRHRANNALVKPKPEMKILAIRRLSAGPSGEEHTRLQPGRRILSQKRNCNARRVRK